EIMNEPYNFGYGGTFGGHRQGGTLVGGPAAWLQEYVNRANNAISKVKTYNPNIKMITSDDIWTANYWVIQAGLDSRLDGFVIHPYHKPFPGWGNSYGYLGYWDMVNDDMSRRSNIQRSRYEYENNFGHDVPPYSTEVGYSLGGDGAHDVQPEEVIAAYLPREYVIEFAAGVEVLTWFVLREPGGNGGAFSLIDTTTSAKRLAYYSLKEMVEQLGDYYMTEQVTGGADTTTGTQMYLFRNDLNQYKAVIWDILNDSKDIYETKSVTVDLADLNITNPDSVKLYDIYGTELTKTFDGNGDLLLDIGISPIYIDGSVIPAMRVRHWKLDETGSDANAVDATGNQDGTLVGFDTSPDWTVGKTGGGLRFDGTTNYVIAGSNTLGDDFTITAWIKRDNASSDRVIFSQYDGSTTGSFMFYVANGKLTAYQDSGSYFYEVGTTTLNVDQWYHVAFVKAGTSGVTYLDGNFEFSNTDGVGVDNAMIAMANIANVIGATATGGAKFDGVMDDVRIYKGALSEAEIGEIIAEIPIRHWKLDETGTDITAIDVRDNQNGTLNNFNFDADSGWTTGQIDGGLRFDGSDDYVAAGSNTLGDDFTITAWIKRDTASSDRMIFSQYDGTTTGAFIFYVANGGKLAAHQDGGLYELGATTLNVDQWYHVAFVKNGTSAAGYIDGNFEFSNAGGDAMIAMANLANIIGAHGTGGRFDGVIDDVRIYGGALSNKALSGVATNPVPYDEDSYASGDVLLSWTPSLFAGSHDVYFGTDFNDVNDANTTSVLISDTDGSGKVDMVDLQLIAAQWLTNPGLADPSADLDDSERVDFVDFATTAGQWQQNSIYRGNQTQNYYSPDGTLEPGTYYWRIDEVVDPQIWMGSVWQFTVPAP
ncbi:MAG: hypothetical protein DRP56_10575, partial [Planctomycetota bacterium]